jgi:hypothetical protein
MRLWYIYTTTYYYYDFTILPLIFVLTSATTHIRTHIHIKVVGGINNNPDDPNAFGDTVDAMINFALLVRKMVQFVPLDDTRFVEIRIGLHVGDAVGGITGRLTPRYCFFGDTINGKGTTTNMFMITNDYYKWLVGWRRLA